MIFQEAEIKIIKEVNPTGLKNLLGLLKVNTQNINVDDAQIVTIIDNQFKKLLKNSNLISGFRDLSKTIGCYEKMTLEKHIRLICSNKDKILAAHGQLNRSPFVSSGLIVTFAAFLFLSTQAHAAQISPNSYGETQQFTTNQPPVRIEKERIEKERIEKERIEKERIEKERIEKERIEKERIEKERIENTLKYVFFLLCLLGLGFSWFKTKLSSKSKPDATPEKQVILLTHEEVRDVIEATCLVLKLKETTYN